MKSHNHFKGNAQSILSFVPNDKSDWRKNVIESLNVYGNNAVVESFKEKEEQVDGAFKQSVILNFDPNDKND